MSLKTTEFVTINNMVIVPHPPYLTDLAHCGFALFPKLKMKLKGRHFETVSDIQRESQAVLESIKENDFHGVFEAWKKTMGSLPTLHVCLCRLCPMFSGTELSAVVFCQHVHPILIFVIFSSGVV
jgi:hypothetical protein